MKKPGLLAVMFAALFTCCLSLQAQKTCQLELVGTIGTEVELLCGLVATGYWVYHINYHVDKDGELTKLHWNLHKSEIFLVETGERVKMWDVGNDNLGALWWLFNNLNAYNASFGADVVYNEEDGWLDEYLPDVYPKEEGTSVALNFKVKTKEVKGRYSSLVHFTLNGNGELTAIVEKTKFFCE